MLQFAARVESSHGELADDSTVKHCASEVWYIPEDNMPTWMKPNVDRGDWVKGKVQCPKCEARLGSYNFVSGMKCSCGLQVGSFVQIRSRTAMLPTSYHIMNFNYFDLS